MRQYNEEYMPAPMSSNVLIAYMFFMHEECRLLQMPSTGNIELLASKYNVTYRDVSFEMLFYAELASPLYYGTEEFSSLCYKCFDFEKLTQLPVEPLPKNARRLNDIKPIDRRNFS